MAARPDTVVVEVHRTLGHDVPVRLHLHGDVLVAAGHQQIVVVEVGLGPGQSVQHAPGDDVGVRVALLDAVVTGPQQPHVIKVTVPGEVDHSLSRRCGVQVPAGLLPYLVEVHVALVPLGERLAEATEVAHVLGQALGWVDRGVGIPCPSGKRLTQGDQYAVHTQAQHRVYPFVGVRPIEATLALLDMFPVDVHTDVTHVRPLGRRRPGLEILLEVVAEQSQEFPFTDPLACKRGGRLKLLGVTPVSRRRRRTGGPQRQHQR